MQAHATRTALPAGRRAILLTLAATMLSAGAPAMASMPAHVSTGPFKTVQADGQARAIRPAILSVAVPEQYAAQDLDLDVEPPLAGRAAVIFLIVTMLIVVVCVAGYAIPILIAFGRGHAYRWPITALTLLGGWTMLGWIIALVWSLLPTNASIAAPDSGQRAPRRDAADQITRLSRLRKRGILTEEEFVSAKARLLTQTVHEGEA